MKIGFNLLRIGMGNNGGTRTLIKCTEVLNSLGHDAYMLSTIDRFTWFDHRPPLTYVPKDLDAIIAASCHDVIPTIRTNIPKKAWYIRAHEDWLLPDKTLRELYISDLTVNLVNSVGLKRKIESFGAKAKVIYQGLDLDLWKDKNLRKNKKIRVGCLYSRKPRKRWADFVKVAKALDPNKYEFVAMGDETPRDVDFLTAYAHKPTIPQLSDFYSGCHIWFAPTDNEGLHNVPMEASLCGALVVCSDHPDNGMVQDYAYEDNAMIYRFGHLDEAIDMVLKPKYRKIPKMQRIIKNKIGSREQNMINLVNYLEKITVPQN